MKKLLVIELYCHLEIEFDIMLKEFRYHCQKLALKIMKP